jgi:hypothetical protein
MKLLNLILFTAIIALSSCYSHQIVNVEVTYSPKLTLKPIPASVLLINHFSVDKAKITSQKKINVLNAGAYSAIKYAGTQLKDLPNVKVVTSVDSANFTVNADSIKLLASKYNVNYVLALKTFKADIVEDVNDNLEVNYNTHVEVSYNLYQPDGTVHRKLDGKSENPRSGAQYPGSIAALIFHPTVGGSSSYINFAAQSATQVALAEYLPYIIKHNRPVYSDDIFLPAVKELQAGNYDKADTLLKPFLKDKSRVTVSKAAYNLSVVYEAEGDISLALDMAKLSLAKGWNQNAADIIIDLEQE